VDDRISCGYWIHILACWLIAVAAVLYGNDDVHAEHQQRAADSASAAAARCHDNGDAQDQLQLAPASHLLLHLRRALIPYFTTYAYRSPQCLECSLTRCFNCEKLAGGLIF